MDNIFVPSVDQGIFILRHNVSRLYMCWMASVFQNLCAGNKFLTEAPNAAEVGTSLDFVDSYDKLSDGINGIGDQVALGAGAFVGAIKCIIT